MELLLTLLQAGDDKIIGDAGRGTIDVSAGANQEIFKAITAPECASFSVSPSPLALIAVRPFSWFHLCQRFLTDLLEQ